MRIHCPYCGPRDLAEFTYHGDAENELARPDPSLDNSEAWNAFVYDRTNPAGVHKELWQHSGGCRKFLIVDRNTVTHEVGKVEMVGAKA